MIQDERLESGDVESEVLERALERLRAVTDETPFAAARAPGRVNLIGEHTDYTGGLVLPIAIERSCVAVAARNGSGKVRVVFDDHPMAMELDPKSLQEPNLAFERGTPGGYVRGVVREFQELGATIPGMTIAMATSVPIGGGLSSSASLEVAMAALLMAATGVRPGLPEVAAMCRRAEHAFAGVPCGIMDQSISAMGKRGRAMLLDCRSGERTHVPMPEGAVVAVINTNVKHSLAEGEYAARQRWCNGATAKLGVESLRELNDDGGLARVERERTKLSGDEYRAARHVVGENQRTMDAAAALKRGGVEDLAEVGRLMNESHDSLRDDYRVSCNELDVVVEIARRTEGVIGARMTGGGFGGCAVALCEPDAVEKLEARLNAKYRKATGLTHSMFVTTAGDGARLVDLAGE